MCGIVGSVRLGAEPNLEHDLRVVTAMRDTMPHRGPDAFGLWHDETRRVVLGHRRLSILDVSDAGRQPMAAPDGATCITYNGEVFNHPTLRRELERLGRSFRSGTDTETVLSLYQERGRDCVHDLNGMYAFGIWDARARELFLVRDRLGVKPLYYTFAGGCFLFASEIKALLEHPAVTADLDEQQLYHYLTFLTTPPPGTLFKGISKLPPGFCARLGLDGALVTERYWDAIVPDQPDLTEVECTREIRSLLTDAISSQMMSDVPFGVFLSGGVDSSTNVALMSELLDRPVDTFTVGFAGDSQYNELDEARQVSRLFGTNHHEVLVDEDRTIEFLTDLVYHQDEPIGDPVCVPVYHVARLAREAGTTVIQVGEGSDEILFGYSGYMQYLRTYGRHWRALQAVHPRLRRVLSGPARRYLELSGRGHLLDFLRRAVDGEELFVSGAIAFFETEKRSLTLPAYRARVEPTSAVVDENYARIDAAKQADFAQRLTYEDLKVRLPELLLMRVDKMTMANSIEARVPFLDHRLVEFAASIPTGLKIRNGIPKYLLKRAMEGLVPNDILYRPKRGFGAPVSAWLRGRLGDTFDKVQQSTGLRQRGLLDFDHVEALFAAHRAGQADNGYGLWALLNLFCWYDHWIGGEGRL